MAGAAPLTRRKALRTRLSMRSVRMATAPDTSLVVQCNALHSDAAPVDEESETDKRQDDAREPDAVVVN
jgi:hypothetical protein